MSFDLSDEDILKQIEETITEEDTVTIGEEFRQVRATDLSLDQETHPERSIEIGRLFFFHHFCVCLFSRFNCPFIPFARF